MQSSAADVANIVEVLPGTLPKPPPLYITVLIFNF